MEALKVLGLEDWVAVDENAVVSRGAVKITEDGSWIRGDGISTSPCPITDQ